MKIPCSVCGKERVGYPARLKLTDRCRECYNRQRHENTKELTCPKCGRTRTVPVSWTRAGSEGYCKTCPRVTDNSIPDTYEAGYVFGVILGDGYLFRNIHKRGEDSEREVVGYGLRLDVKSEAFARKFAVRLGECSGKKPWVRGCAHKGMANEAIKMPAQDWTRWTVIVWSREWYDKLAPVKKDRDFDLLRGMGADFKHGFVDGMVDSEGYVRRTVSSPYTDVANKDIELLNLVCDFLREMGHKAKVYGPYTRGVFHLRTVPWEKTT